MRKEIGAIGQQLYGRSEKSYGFFLGIEKSQVFRTFPGPVDEVWALQAMKLLSGSPNPRSSEDANKQYATSGSKFRRSRVI